MVLVALGVGNGSRDEFKVCSTVDTMCRCPGRWLAVHLYALSFAVCVRTFQNVYELDNGIRRERLQTKTINKLNISLPSR